MSAPDRNLLFEKIPQDEFTRRTASYLLSHGIICNADFAVRTKQALADLPGLGVGSMREIRQYARRQGLSFRTDKQSLAARIRALFTSVLEAPVSSLSVVAKEGSLSAMPLLRLEEAGVRTIGDLQPLTSDQIANIVGRFTIIDSAFVAAICQARTELLRLQT